MIDHAAAALLAIAALVMLVWGIRRHLSQGDTQLSEREDSRDFTSERARRFHADNSVGR